MKPSKSRLRSSNLPSSSSTCAREREPPPKSTVVIELGASHVEARVRTDDGIWRQVRFPRDDMVRADNTCITIAALPDHRPSRAYREPAYGYAAYMLRIRASPGWAFFSNLKAGLMDGMDVSEAVSVGSLEQEQTLAINLDKTLEEVAKGFFEHVLRLVLTDLPGNPRVFVNLVDRWTNASAQHIVHSLGQLTSGAELCGVDECFASVIGSLPQNRIFGGVPECYIVVDCGHSTMNIGSVRVEGETVDVTSAETHRLGASYLDSITEKATRAMIARSDEMDEEILWDILRWLDDTFKPTAEPGRVVRGLTAQERSDLVETVSRASADLDRWRIAKIEAVLHRTKAESDDVRVILTGRASLSPSFVAAFNHLIREHFSDVKVHRDGCEEQAVICGLQRIAENPALLDTDTIPVSLGLTNDRDRGGGQPAPESPREVVRICIRGQSIAQPVRRQRNVTHAIRFDLESDEARFTIDLSVYGTPHGVSDNDITEGFTGTGFRYTTIDRVVRFGHFPADLPMHLPTGRDKAHAYVFMHTTRMKTTFYVVWAVDGHELKDLEQTPYTEVIRENKLVAEWSTHHGVSLDLLLLGQIVRPEHLATDPPEFVGEL